MIAKGQITITSLSNGKTINSWIECAATQQVYNKTTATYNPDWSTPENNLILTPKVVIAGNSNDLFSAGKCRITSWSINDVIVTPGGSSNPLNATYETNTSDSKYGKLIIRGNIVSEPVVSVVVNGYYVDVDSKHVDFQSQVSLNKISNGTDAIRVLLFTGSTGNIIENGEGEIELMAHSYRGSVEDCSKMDFKWYKASGSGWEPITPDASGYVKDQNGTTIAKLSKVITPGIPSANQADTDNKLTIYPGFIDNVEVIKVTCKDVDPNSLTPNDESLAILDVKDVTDVYQIEFDANGGTTLTTENSSTTIHANVYQKGEPVTNITPTWLWHGYYPTDNGLNRAVMSEWEERMGSSLGTNNVSLRLSDLVEVNTSTVILSCQATF